MGGTEKILEWDEHKRHSNLRKHGLDFSDCARVFMGLTVTILDDRHDYGELRYSTPGLLDGRAVLVVHTEEDSGLCRIISFRKAKKHEQTQYFKTFQNRLETRRCDA